MNETSIPMQTFQAGNNLNMPGYRRSHGTAASQAATIFRRLGVRDDAVPTWDWRPLENSA